MKWWKTIYSVNSSKRYIPTKAYPTRLYLSINCVPLTGPYKPIFLQKSTMKGPMLHGPKDFVSQKFNLQIKKADFKCFEKAPS